MNHKKRYETALRLSKELEEEHRDNLICCCLYGSTARGEDTHWSDLELFAVTKKEIKPRHLLIDMVPVGINTITEARLIHILENPALEWPFYAGLVANLTVLSGNYSAPARYYEAAMSVPKEKFKIALQRSLPELVFESWGRIFSCIARRKYEDIYCAVIETLLEMRTALCLLNGKHVSRDYFEGIKESFGFEKKPKDYPKLATRLWNSHDPAAIAKDARELMENYISLLKAEGIVPN